MDQTDCNTTENQKVCVEVTESSEEKEPTLEDYMSKVDVVKCPGCKYDSSTENVRLHIKRLHLDKRFCNICDKEFTERRDEHCAKHLLIAIISHLREQCSECSEFFMLDTKSSEEVEFKCKDCAAESGSTETPVGDHELKGLHRCDTCFQRFAHRRTLTRHVQNFHGDSEMYQCKICKETFHRRKHLVKHRRTHNTPFV